MSHYTPYPAYKDSGVEWLGSVPEHWVVSPLWSAVTVNDDEREPFENESVDVEYVDISSVSLEGGIAASTLMQAKDAPSRAQRKAKAGDVVISTVRTYLRAIGKVFQHHESAVFSTGFAVVRSGRLIHHGFIYYALLSDFFLSEMESRSTGVSYPAINASDLLKIKCLIPSLSEQRVIAIHLDCETARIDALVSKKTRFIELLREKRQALISHAVTKGLDPTATMKDSGVEWLGEVPEHWAVCKLSFRYSVELGKMLDEKKLTKTSLVPYLRNQDVQWGAINTQSLPEMDIHPAELERYTVMNGDLMVCEGGDVGRAAIWSGESSVFGYQKALHRLRPRSQNTDTAEFFFFSLLTAKKRGVFEESDSKATIAHLPAEKFRQYRFAFPPKLEQREIADHVHVESERLDVLLTQTERSVELLKERRSALITAAVTGQIDLRDRV